MSILVDHFESRSEGRTFSSFGRRTSEHCVGGCIFVDRMSGYLQVEHQLGFSSIEKLEQNKDMKNIVRTTELWWMPT